MPEETKCTNDGSPWLSPSLRSHIVHTRCNFPHSAVSKGQSETALAGALMLLSQAPREAVPPEALTQEPFLTMESSRCPPQDGCGGGSQSHSPVPATE